MSPPSRCPNATSRPEASMNPRSPVRESHGIYSLSLQPCSTRILADVLDPSVPFVWIQRHMPRPEIRWSKTSIALNAEPRTHEVEVRSLEFDLLLATHDFLRMLPEFESHGMVLYQMARRVPDTLTLAGMSETSVHQVLVQNGWRLKFFLPHAQEVAVIVSPDRTVLENLLLKPAVRQLILELVEFTTSLVDDPLPFPVSWNHSIRRRNSSVVGRATTDSPGALSWLIHRRPLPEELSRPIWLDGTKSSWTSCR